MLQTIKAKKAILFCSCSLLVVILTAWQIDSTAIKVHNNIADTTEPIKKQQENYSTAEAEKAIKEMDKAMLELDKEMKKIDYKKIQKDIDAAMSTLKDIDVKKLEKEINLSLKKIDWTQIKTEIDKALKEIELNNTVGLNTTELSKSLNNLAVKLEDKDFNVKLNGKELATTIEKGLQTARAGLEKVKSKISATQQLVEVLQQDGLIDKQKGFSIKLENEKLFINGKEQTNAIYKKYKKYYYSDKITINSNGSSIIKL